MIAKYFSKITKTVSFSFDKPIYLYEKGTGASNNYTQYGSDNLLDFMTCTLDGEMITPKSLKITDSNLVQAKIDIEYSLQDAEFSIQLNNNNNDNSSVLQFLLADNNNINSFYDKFPLTTKISIYIDNNSKGLSSASRLSAKGSSVLTGGVLVSNPASAITMMRLLQSFEFYSYINIDTPEIVISFLQTFDFNIFNAIPNLLGDFTINEDPY